MNWTKRKLNSLNGRGSETLISIGFIGKNDG